MKWSRKTVKNRTFILALVLVETFHFVDAEQFVYAHEIREEREVYLQKLSALLGVLVEKLRGERRSLVEPVEKLAGEVAEESPLGTLQERQGTSWDQAWLLQQLLTAASVDARHEWGEVEISAEMLQNVTGVEDTWRAGDLMTTAGTPMVLLAEGSQVRTARMSHVWVKVHLDYIPNRGVTPGPGDTWIRMDPSLKRFAIGGDLRLYKAVPYDLEEHLQSDRELSPRLFHEEALQA